MLLLLSGILLGGVIGLTGIGAGSLALPWLLWLGLPLEVALGTALLASSLVKVYGLYEYGSRGLVDWGVVRGMWLGSLPVVVLLGLFALGSVGGLLWVVGVMVLLTGLLVLLRGSVYRGGGVDRDSWLGLGGGVIGASMVLTSVGAGVLSTMWLLWTKPSLRGMRLVGTELAHAVPVAGVAGLFYASRGLVSWEVLSFLLSGMLVGMWISTRYMSFLKTIWIQRAVAILLIALGIKMAV